MAFVAKAKPADSLSAPIIYPRAKTIFLNAILGYVMILPPSAGRPNPSKEERHGF
jgi:hypothetical protein